ncbi:endospore germination permease [Paenibacillus sp. SI8]|uniref:GerAB/ArcD/ProY family transporter n=1 Tax=unclassified Paenibacillus TaxID=185978 RepID=UPI0034668593
MMNKYAFNEITFIQYILLTSGMSLSVVFLTVPQVLAEKAGTDGWIALLIGWIISVAASLVVIQVMKKCPDGTLLDLLTRYLGKWAGRVAAILFALYFFYYGYTGMVLTVLVTKDWLLPQTQAYLIMLLLLVSTYLIIRGGMRSVGRYAEIVIFVSLWIPIVYLLPLKNAHWLYLLPVIKEGWKPVWTAVPSTFFYYLGFATSFIFYPFLKDKQKASIGIVTSLTLTLLAYLFITLVCFVYFSPDEIRVFNQPGISVLKLIEFKFLERIELLFIAFYILIFSLGWLPSMYASLFCTSWLLGKKEHRGHLRLFWLVIAIGTYFFMPTNNQSDKLNAFLGKIGLGFEYVFPVCLLIYLWIHDRFVWRKNE